MVVIPNSKIILLKSPLRLDNYNQITFSNAEAQYNYFNSLPKLELQNATYQRKDGIIRFPTRTKANDNLPVFEDLLLYNYVMYQNTSYKNKWFYAFITDIKYSSDGMSEITIETDVFQTWQFQLIYKNSFIEREHVSNDAIGLHTLPEGLETGEYVNNSKTKFGIGTCHAVICTTDDPFRQGVVSNGIINSVPTGLCYFVVGDFTSYSFIDWLVDWVANNSDLSFIQSIIMVPDSMTGYTLDNSYWKYASGTGGFQYAPYHKLDSRIDGASNLGDTSITKPYSNINGYYPRNNKLFCYPYNFLMIDNNGGSAYEYRYEDFSTNDCVFSTKGAISPGCSLKTIPKNYKGVEYNYSEGVNGLKLPVGSWQGDVYTNWLTQNAVNLGVSFATSTAGIIGGAVAGNPASAVGGMLGIASTLGSVYEHSKMPNQVYGNTNVGDVTYADSESTFTAYQKSIKYEYAQIIDNFFTMYGYKVNRLATPNIFKRSNWDYIKCIDVNLEGDIPEKDMDKIRALFNNGCTFWHTTNYYLDYSRTNSIL